VLSAVEVMLLSQCLLVCMSVHLKSEVTFKIADKFS